MEFLYKFGLRFNVLFEIIAKVFPSVFCGGEASKFAFSSAENTTELRNVPELSRLISVSTTTRQDERKSAVKARESKARINFGFISQVALQGL